jgi:hypothetical protein
MMADYSESLVAARKHLKQAEEKAMSGDFRAAEAFAAEALLEVHSLHWEFKRLAEVNRPEDLDKTPPHGGH